MLAETTLKHHECSRSCHPMPASLLKSWQCRCLADTCNSLPAPCQPEGIEQKVALSKAGRACKIWMDAALHADFRSSSVPGFSCPPADLCHGEQIGWTPQLLCSFALAEGTELAGIDASVGVVDVPIHSVCDPAQPTQLLASMLCCLSTSGNLACSQHR